jgi:hypothetical protein
MAEHDWFYWNRYHPDVSELPKKYYNDKNKYIINNSENQGKEEPLVANNSSNQSADTASYP